MDWKSNLLKLANQTATNTTVGLKAVGRDDGHQKRSWNLVGFEYFLKDLLLSVRKNSQALLSSTAIP